MKKILAFFIASVLIVSAAIVGASAGSNIDPWIGSWSAAYRPYTLDGSEVLVEETMVISESAVMDKYPYVVRKESVEFARGKTRVAYAEFLAAISYQFNASGELVMHSYDGVTVYENPSEWNSLTLTGEDSLKDVYSVAFMRSDAAIRYGKNTMPGHWQFVSKTNSDLQAMIDYNAFDYVCSLTAKGNVFTTISTSKLDQKTIRAEHYCEAPPETIRIGDAITLKAYVDLTGSDTMYRSHIAGIGMVCDLLRGCDITGGVALRHITGQTAWSAIVNGQALTDITRCDSTVTMAFTDTDADKMALSIRVYNGELFSYDVQYNYIWVDPGSSPGAVILPEQSMPTAIPMDTEQPEVTSAPTETEPPEATAIPVETKKPEVTAKPKRTQKPENTAEPKATTAPGPKAPGHGRTPETEDTTSAIVDIAAGEYFTLGLKQDGTVVAAGDNSKGQCDIEDWNGIEAIAAGLSHSVGLTRDGEAVATGDNELGQCDVEGWEDIVEISAGYGHTVGLKGDGTVVAVGYNGDGQCNVAKWRNIIAVVAGGWHTVGLKADGTVVATGYNQYGQCIVKKWSGIVALSAGGWHTVVVKKNGKVGAVGYGEGGQCDVGVWRSIEAVSASGYHTVGLTGPGTAVAVGNDDFDQCDVEEWENIIELAAGGYHTVALLADGSVFAVGYDAYGQCQVSDWGAGPAESYDGTRTASDEAGDTGSAGE